MTVPKGLLAYPSTPPEIGNTFRAALDILRSEHGISGLSSWEQNDIAGRCISDPILSKIDDGNILVADITRLNFNVVYEIGYAIGRKKRVFLTKNSALTFDDVLIREIGIFDTLGYQPYQTSRELAHLVRSVEDVQPNRFDERDINFRVPVYVLMPRRKTDPEVRIISRIKKARLQFRTFDPEEQGRLSAREAIDNVARSHGVVVPLVCSNHVEAKVHNFRAAFVAGLAHAMDKQLLLMQSGDDPVPIDYRDLVSSYKFPDQIDGFIAEFAADITARLQSEAEPVISEPETFLARLNLGASAAENELGELGYYYLETDEYRRTLRGEVHIVAGRKGSGKTALFAQLRDKLRQNKQTIVLDLKPEGFQLLKFKEVVLDLLEEGTKEHTITAFWEYLLLLETCYKILEKDKVPHVRDHRLFAPYQALAKAYLEDAFVSEGDFAERMLMLTQRIAEDFEHGVGRSETRHRLNTAEITELLYKHDVAQLRQQVSDYLPHKAGLWILFDNLDKGWPPHGLKSDDLITLRCLLDAMAKMERSLSKQAVQCHGIIFIRNDVYELLLENTPDRGKVSRVTLDWTDSDLLRELLRRRFVYSGLGGDPSFEQIWRQICISHVGGEESSQYMIDRCLMRPRSLIELLQLCRSHAVNLGHQRIEQDDIKQGEQAYSTDLLTNISFEIRDVCPEAEDVLYVFIGSQPKVSTDELTELLVNAGLEKSRHDRIVDLLLWHGVLGFVRDDGEIAYVYSVKYDMMRLKSLIGKTTTGKPAYYVNPALWEGLEIRP